MGRPQRAASADAPRRLGRSRTPAGEGEEEDWGDTDEEREKLERENNLLKLKVLLFINRCFGLYYSWSCQVEILLDMLAQKTAETSLQV